MVKIKSMINELQLELTNYCNSRCTMCPREYLQRPFGYISCLEATNIINQAVALGVKTVKPQWYGESLLHPNYLDLIAYIKRLGLRVIITTNGVLMTRERADELLRLGADRINFSIDSANKNDYEEIRRGLSFETVKSNLEYLYRRKKETGAKTFIQIDSVCHEKYNRAEMEQVFSGMCDNIVTNALSGTPTGGKVCLHKVYDRLVVAWNGKCYLCCHDWLGEYEIGDSNINTLAEIWSGEKRQEYLKNLSNLEICLKCM